MTQTAYPLQPRPFPQLLSLVIPLYNEEEVIPLLRKEIEAFLDTLPCRAEVLVVNDGSNDRTPRLLADWAAADQRIKVLQLARNFGHQYAATAGLDHARGHAVVLMDGDLQDPPELIHDMLARYCEGYDVVYAQRAVREGESAFKRASAWLFYRLMRKFVHKDLPVDAGDYRLLSEQCLHALRGMRETHRFLRGMVAWVGFPQTAVRFRRPSRTLGETKYPLRRMLRFAWTAALSFSPLPLKLSLGLGILVALAGFAYGIYATIRVFLGLYVVPGWTSLLVAVLLIGGAILISLGIVGEYIARIFEEVKGRPLYLVRQSINLESADELGEVTPHERVRQSP